MQARHEADRRVRMQNKAGHMDASDRIKSLLQILRGGGHNRQSHPEKMSGLQDAVPGHPQRAW
jgi:hypothetical protein